MQTLETERSKIIGLAAENLIPFISYRGTVYVVLDSGTYAVRTVKDLKELINE